jgi:hypothetical protein
MSLTQTYQRPLRVWPGVTHDLIVRNGEEMAAFRFSLASQ